MSESHSYARILRSTSVMGLASAVNAVLGIVRIKLMAVLLGPGGIGLVSLYTTTTTLIGTLTSAGWPTSAVRVLAQAHEQSDAARLAEIAEVLRRACWVSGLIGWLLTAALSLWLSDWIFASRDHAGALGLLGATVWLGALASWHNALLQGVQRIADLARINIVATLLNTALSVALYAGVGRDGIVPAMLATAVVNLGVARHVAARIHPARMQLSWSATWQGWRRLAGLGLALTWVALLTAALDVFVRTLVMRQLGLDAAGHYQAAWVLSGVFAGFILTSMASDYFPRLSAHIHDHEAAVRIINHQTEIGLLVALPGLIATLAFAPLLMTAFYSRVFLPGAELMPWFVLGLCGRLVSWPLGFVAMAADASRLFAVTETLFVLMQGALAVVLVRHGGLVGTAQAFAVGYAIYVVVVRVIAQRLIGFRWSTRVLRLLALCTFAGVAFFAASRSMQGPAAIALGLIAVLTSALFSLRELVHRLDADQPLPLAIRRFAPWLAG